MTNNLFSGAVIERIMGKRDFKKFVANYLAGKHKAGRPRGKTKTKKRVSK